MTVQMTTDTVKNANMTTKSVVIFVFFEKLTTEKSATESQIWKKDSYSGARLTVPLPAYLFSFCLVLFYSTA